MTEQQQKELANIKERLAKVEILVIDETYAHIFGSLRNDIRTLVGIVDAPPDSATVAGGGEAESPESRLGQITRTLSRASGRVEPLVGTASTKALNEALYDTLQDLYQAWDSVLHLRSELKDQSGS